MQTRDGYGLMRRRRQAAALTAMALAPMLACIGALPSQAAEVDALSRPATVAPAAQPQLQSLTVTAEAAVPVQVDGFTAVELPPPPPPPPVIAPELAPAPAAVGAAAATPAGPAVHWPFPGAVRIAGGYGPRAAPCSGCSTFHDGLDMNPGAGTPIGSIAAGTVTSVTTFDDGGLGVHVMVEHVVDGQMVTSTYGHMAVGSVAVSEGQSVITGQVLGAVGSTGQSTGPHLHLEIHPGGTEAVDPFAWLTRYAGAQ